MEFTLSFMELERVLGVSLPKSAFRYPAWWANQRDTSTRSQAKAWLSAGFRVDGIHLSQVDGWVRFVRAGNISEVSPRKKALPLVESQHSFSSTSLQTENRSSASYLEHLPEEFQFICVIEPVRNSQGSLEKFWPHQRYENVHGLSLNKYGAGPFCRFDVPNARLEEGVYAVTLDGGVVYIGESKNLSSRWGSAGYGAIQPRNCFEGGQSTNCKVNNLILQSVESGKVVELWFLAIRDRKGVEANLIRLFHPDWNTQLRT
ncbi:MAG: GIY-YIG nuclease family protein [Gammaproteobacteria bacterium]|nr:GIY-YIG nuclease family protein [Gammaproteobacteria bacterium]